MKANEYNSIYSIDKRKTVAPALKEYNLKLRKKKSNRM